MQEQTNNDSTDQLPGQPHGALKGLVVLDLTQMLAGPFATMLLADQGARVIKIEPPGGEATRRFLPMLKGAPAPDKGGSGGYFASINRNKESIVLDLKCEAGRAVFRRLVGQSHVVVENFRTGVMDRLGLSYEALSAINPKLVYAAIRGFGDPRTGASPYQSWPAYDVVSQAMGGIMGITGPVAGGAPTKIGPGVGDIVPGMLAVIGILAAQRHAEITGEGQFVDVAMADGVLAMCERIITQLSYGGAVPGPEGNGHPLLCPFGLYPASDGHVTIACPHDKFWIELTKLMGCPELGTAAHLATTPDRLAHSQEVAAAVSAWTSQRTKAEIMAQLGGRIPMGPVYRADEIARDPHFATRDMIVTAQHPGAGKVELVNTPIKMTRTPGGVRHGAPMAGVDTMAVLRESGFGDDEIAALAASGAIAGD